MDIIQDTYRSSQEKDDLPVSSFLSTSQQKSFESIVKTPYQSPYVNGENRSIESPYTSLGSGRSSYVSIKQATYSTLRAKAEKASSLHESKSKAVMNALKNLQDKIAALETDRIKAENNMKTLANETKEYKELLSQQHAITPVSDHGKKTTYRRRSHSDELECQLENAQGRCELLEKQLEYMRKMMQGQPCAYPISPQTNTSSGCIPVSSPGYSVITPNQLKSTGQQQNTTPNHPIVTSNGYSNSGSKHVGIPKQVPVEESPAHLDKLNDLEKEHLKLSAFQSHTESKIRELEEKIREETHCRKLLEDKATELQKVVAFANTSKLPDDTVKAKWKDDQKPKQNKRKKKKILKNGNHHAKTSPAAPTMLRPPPIPLSPTHYHLDLANIPFVVGQSTSRSHSVGANVQNVLSLMKSHSKLCCYGDVQRCTDRRTRTPSPKTKNELQDLLKTLNDEFQQLSGEHRALVTRLQEDQPLVVLKNIEKDVQQVIERMETKGKQINTIRDLLFKSTPVASARSAMNGVNNRINIGSQELEVVTTIRSARRKSADVKTNKNLQLLKEAKKLQCTLQKDDLKWE